MTSTTTPIQPEIQAWTTRRMIQWTTDHLDTKQVQNPRLVAETLLAHVLGVERLRLYMEMDRPASSDERSEYRGLVERAARHEPVDYLVAGAPFFSMWLRVTPDTLVPRPSTETLVEHMIQHARVTPGFEHPTIADIGTGSGAIACALGKHLDGSRIIATDISQNALKVAKENISQLGLDSCIELRQGDLLAPLGNQRFRYLVSNPPYISDAQWLEVPKNVKDYEPTHALRGGQDGLDYLRVLIENAPSYLMSPGQLVLEIAYSQQEAVLELVQQTPGLVNARVLNDHENLPRVLVADMAQHNACN